MNKIQNVYMKSNETKKFSELVSSDSASGGLRWANCKERCFTTTTRLTLNVAEYTVTVNE